MDALGKRLVQSHLYGCDSGRLSYACNNAIGLSTILYMVRLCDIYRVMRNYALVSRVGNKKQSARCSQQRNPRRVKRAMKSEGNRSTNWIMYKTREIKSETKCISLEQVSTLIYITERCVIKRMPVFRE